MNVALNLARLGVDRITLLDYDVVDASNLNRQCLGGHSDLGKKKIQSAMENLYKFHNIRSEIQPLNIDVVKDWHKVVVLARQATVVFNAVDVGSSFDLCVTSLAKAMQVPLISGQSFAWKFMAETYSGDPSGICMFCLDQALLRSALELTPTTKHTTILALQSLFRKNKSVADTVLREFLAKRYGCDVEGIKDVVRKCLRTPKKLMFEDVEVFLDAFANATFNLMLPSEVIHHSNLSFIPRPKVPDTRFIGSWVAPCLGCATIMVSNFTNMLTGPTDRNPPVTSTFNLDEGMTAVESMAYEMAALGMTLEKSERNFSCSTPSAESCPICIDTKRMLREQELYFSGKTVYLEPTNGDVTGVPLWEIENLSSAKKLLAKIALERSERVSVKQNDGTNKVSNYPQSTVD